MPLGHSPVTWPVIGDGLVVECRVKAEFARQVGDFVVRARNPTTRQLLIFAIWLTTVPEAPAAPKPAPSHGPSAHNAEQP
jgi:hypothetical protein